MNHLGRYLASLAALAMLAGCGVKESVADASSEVERFHAALNRGDSVQIWDAADQQLRTSTPRAQFERFTGAIRKKLGNVVATKQVGWNANATTGGTFLTLTMETTFERGTGTEQFVYHKVGEHDLKLVGYNIQSQDMMLN